MNFNAERLKAEEERKKWIKEYEDMKEQEMWELNKTTEAIYNPQTYLYKTPGIAISPSTPKV